MDVKSMGILPMHEGKSHHVMTRNSICVWNTTGTASKHRSINNILVEETPPFLVLGVALIKM